MAYMPYVTADEYIDLVAVGYPAIPSEQLDLFLKTASRQIDTLTFNRIVKRTFGKLTEFQQEIIKEVVCKQAGFLFENQDAIESILDSYSINGVSMHFGTGFNVELKSGVPIQRTVYSLLEQTGLCWRGAV